MLIFNRAKLAENLRLLSHRWQLAFAASCCERLLPNYEAFTIMEQWGDPSVLRKVLDKVWKIVEGETIPQAEVNHLISLCTDAMPNSEDFESIFTSLAQYAAASLLHTLRSGPESNTDELAQVGELAMESIDAYLNTVCDPYIETHGTNKAFDEWIGQAPMLMQELNKQQEDIKLIRSWEKPSIDLVRSLQESSKLVGIQPFDRRIIKNTGA